MRLSLVFFVAAFCASLGVSASAPAQSPVRAPDPAPTVEVDFVELENFEPTREEAVLEAFVDGVVASHRRAHDTPGVTVSVVKDGRVLFSKGYGLADAAAARAVRGDETLFRIGSVSKTFIWTAVMILHERGQIDLDADVNEYLKDLSIPEAFGAGVTMNDLMAHRAGFEDTFGVFTYSDESEISLTDALRAEAPKRVFAPGVRTSYSNWGAALAAKIVEDVSGVPYGEFVQREILAPMAMLDTTMAAPATMDEAHRERHSKGYSIDAGAYVEADYMGIGPFAPAGAMSSTANDMAQWMLLHLGGGAHNGAQLMTPQTHALMLSRAFSDRAGGADVAHGFQTTFHRGVETFGHGGATAAFFTNMVMAPGLGVGVFISQNATSDRTLVSDLPALVIDHLLDGQIAPARASGGDVAASEYAGTYLGNRRSFTQFEILFAANQVTTVTPVLDGALTLSTFGQASHYAPVPGRQDMFENRKGARVVFGRDARGRITHFSDGSAIHSYERVGVFTNPQTLNIALGLAVLLSVTTILGAWRRQGRVVSHGGVGAWLNRADFAVAGIVLVFFGLLIAVFVTLSTSSAADMKAYPPSIVSMLRLAGLLVFAASVAMVASVAPAWLRSGWGVWRKLHHTAFVLAVAFLAVMLVFWRVIFSATA